MWVINCAGSAQYREGGNILKKLLGLALMAMLALGGGSAFADPTTPACDAPADVACTTEDENGDEQSCTVYIAADSDLDGCYNA